jgi:hypothetical protein
MHNTRIVSGTMRTNYQPALLKTFLELMDDKKSVLIQQIKNVIVELVHYSEEPLIINFLHILNSSWTKDVACWKISLRIIYLETERSG